MKLSLRKANALQNSMQEHIKTIEVNTSISINEFQKSADELSAALKKFVANDARRTALTNALYGIRSGVGRANVESGVADLLTKAAYIDKRIGQLKGYTDSKVQETETVLEGKLSKMREQESKSRIYGYNDSVESGVLTEELMEALRTEMRNLKKEKQSINDKVLELNVRTEIELAAEVVTLLQAEQLI